MKLKEIYTKYKFVIWPLLSGIASIIILILVIIPQFLTYLNTNGKIADVTNRSSSLEVKAQSLERFDEEINKRNLQTVLTILPTEQDVPKSMAVVENLISSSGLELKNTTYVVSRKVADKPSFQLNVTVAGQISAIRNFLISLQDASQVLQIDSISVQFRKSGSEVEADIPISVFYEAPPKSIGSIDQPVAELNQEEERLLARLSRLIPKVSVSGSKTPEATPSSVILGKADPFE